MTNTLPSVPRHAGQPDTDLSALHEREGKQANPKGKAKQNQPTTSPDLSPAGGINDTDDGLAWINQPIEAFESKSYAELAEEVEERIHLADQDRLEVGTFLRDTLFYNDQKSFQSRLPKDSSLRKLSAALEHRGKISLPPSTLHQLVAVSFQEDSLELGDAEKHWLSYTHRVRLLVVRDRELKNHLAGEAIRNHWSTDTLAEQIKKHKHAGKPARKPAIDLVLRELRKLDRLIDDLEGENKDPDDWGMVKAALCSLVDKAAKAFPVSAGIDNGGLSERTVTYSVGPGVVWPQETKTRLIRLVPEEEVEV